MGTEDAAAKVWQQVHDSLDGQAAEACHGTEVDDKCHAET